MRGTITKTQRIKRQMDMNALEPDTDGPAILHALRAKSSPSLPALLTLLDPLSRCFYRLVQLLLQKLLRQYL